VWLWNVENGEFEIDESLKTLFGLSAREVGTADLRLRQADFFALIHPDDRLAHARYLRSLLTSDATEYFNEFRIAPPGGAVLDIQARGTVFRNEQGKLLTVVGVAWDATQLMETRRALEAKTAALVKMDQRYRLATQSARVGAWVWDIAGGRFEIDASMAAVFGFSAPDGKTARVRTVPMAEFMARVHPEDRARVNEEGIAALKSDTREYFQEYRIRLNNGEVRGIQSRGSMYRRPAATRCRPPAWPGMRPSSCRRAARWSTGPWSCSAPTRSSTISPTCPRTT
jgi:PAS domain S-box-containing protein